MSQSRSRDKLIVVKHRPGIKRRNRLMFLTVAVVFAAVGFLAGSYHLGTKYHAATSRLEELSRKYSQLQVSERTLNQQVTNLKRGREIDDFAKQEIQDTIRQLKSEVSQLKKDVSFYRNIMAPSDNTQGLQVQIVEIEARKPSDHYDYKIVLTQVANNKTYVSGLVAVNLIGMKDDEKEVIPLRDISEVEDLGIKFRFRYFQDITGQLILPEDFEPDSLQIVAQSKGRNASRLEQSFDWSQLVNKSG